MKLKSSRASKSLAVKGAELAMATPQVVAHRMARMVLAGPNPSPRDRQELAPRHFVWKETFTITAGGRARWACGQAASEPVHMSTGRSSSGGIR